MNIMKKELYERAAVGQRIREQRIFKNISQMELSSIIGRNDNYIYEIERGKSGMSLDTALSIASVLDMSLDLMIYGPEAEQKNFSETAIAVMKCIDECETEHRNLILFLVMQMVHKLKELEHKDT